ncbi:MAG: Na+-transporting NADH:ubiquinone oxidoreductase subunit A, partial [Limisphaerales bacterium]
TTDFIGISPIPKLHVGTGDHVKAGDQLFYDKARPEIQYSAPVSGEVIEVKRGEKRRITEVIIKPDEQISYKEFPKAEPLLVDRQEAIDQLLESGAWASIRQRPFNVVADPTDDPKAIHISGFDTSPLSPDYNFVFEGRKQAFQHGLNLLTRLTSGKVHLNLSADHKPTATFNEAENVQINWFDGPHPAGNVGVQIHHIDPINKADVVWTIRPQDVITIGKLFTDGIYDPERVVALAGPEVIRPRYIKTRLGANISELLKDNLQTSNVRVISGNVLTGSEIPEDGHIGYYDDLVTVVSEGNQPELFGWLLPAYPRPSLSKSFPIIANDTPQEGYWVNTNMHGEERAFVVSGEYEKVLPMDIFPVHLLKAIMARDFDLMEGLGIYEVDTEDLALCEFVCTSKIDVQAILREGLEYMRSQN